MRGRAGRSRRCPAARGGGRICDSGEGQDRRRPIAEEQDRASKAGGDRCGESIAWHGELHDGWGSIGDSCVQVRADSGFHKNRRERRRLGHDGIWLEVIRDGLAWQILAVVLVGVAGGAARRLRRSGVGMRRRGCGSERIREELETYARLDATAAGGMGMCCALGMRVCRVVAEASAFRRVAMLVRDADGRLYVAASAGMDDRTVAALDRWCRRVVKMQPGAVARGWNRDETGWSEDGDEELQGAVGVGGWGGSELQLRR